MLVFFRFHICSRGWDWQAFWATTSAIKTMMSRHETLVLSRKHLFERLGAVLPLMKRGSCIFITQSEPQYDLQFVASVCIWSFKPWKLSETQKLRTFQKKHSPLMAFIKPLRPWDVWVRSSVFSAVKESLAEENTGNIGNMEKASLSYGRCFLVQSLLLLILFHRVS